MRITILGASGGTGRELVKQALAGGHEVTAFVRTPAKLTITHPALLVLQGNVGDASAVSNAVAGRDAVLSCLGVGTPLKHDPVVIAGIRHLVSAMSAMPASRRLIYQSFIGVRDSRAAAGWLIRNVARF